MKFLDSLQPTVEKYALAMTLALIFIFSFWIYQRASIFSENNWPTEQIMIYSRDGIYFYFAVRASFVILFFLGLYTMIRTGRSGWLKRSVLFYACCMLLDNAVIFFYLRRYIMLKLLDLSPIQLGWFRGTLESMILVFISIIFLKIQTQTSKKVKNYQII